MTNLRIRQMHNRYCVNDRASADDLQQRLDRTVADRLPALLDRGLSGLRQRLGLPAESRVAIRRVNVRLRLADAQSTTAAAMVDTIATAWSEAIVNGIERILTTAGLVPGEVLLSDTLAVFPDLNSARRHHLRQMVRTGAVPWWSAALLGDDAAPAALPQLLISLAGSDLPAAAAVIIELGDTRGLAWLEQLNTDQRRQLEQLFAPTPEHAVGGSHTSSDPATPTEASTSPPQRAPGQPRLAGEITTAILLSWVRRVAGDKQLPPASSTVPVDYPPKHQLAPTPARPEDDHHAASDPAIPTEMRPLPDRSDASSAHATGDKSMPALASAIPVGCSGLLFLIRFALQHRSPDSSNFNRDMLALGTRLLDGVFDRLSPAARRAAWRRDRMLLQVFAGLREPIEEIDTLDHSPAACRWAATLCELIDNQIDADIAAAANACEYVLGASGVTLSPLERLLLRPGRLRVTDTDARLLLPAALIDIGLRRGGWDIDPGWVPRLGRIIRFEYQD